MVNLAFQKPDLPLLTRCLLQLRLTTMMRSVDAAKLVSGLFEVDGKFYVKVTEKNGQPLTFNVTGQTLRSVIDYLWVHRAQPAPFLFRYANKPHCCLGSQRLAKIALNAMSLTQIHTSVFKSHSLRGGQPLHGSWPMV